MIIAHKVELLPNKEQQTHFHKAFGCARFARNWAISQWNENYKLGIKKTALDLKKDFNAIKRDQFPFVCEVSKYATQQAFIHVGQAIQKFFEDRKKGKMSRPRYHKKRLMHGSYYIGGDQVVLADCNKITKKTKALTQDSKHQYLKVPKLGYVKLRERVRFEGKILSVTISQKGDRYYASFAVEISHEEFFRTHPEPRNTQAVVGIDVGLKAFVCLSHGLAVNAPKPLDKLTRKLKRLSRQLAKKQHPKTKGDRTKRSANYYKQSLKVCRLHAKIANIRRDFLHKLTSTLVKHSSVIVLEDLNVAGMLKNHKLAKSLSDVSFSEFKRQITYKCANAQREVIFADRFYPSSKLCSHCGAKKETLSLATRTYRCEQCGVCVDRDWNASVNLAKLANEQLGRVPPEVTPADLTALLADLTLNQLTTSKVETGIQQKSCL